MSARFPNRRPEHMKNSEPVEPQEAWKARLDHHTQVICCPRCSTPALIRIGDKSFNLGQLYIACDGCGFFSEADKAQAAAIKIMSKGAVS